MVRGLLAGARAESIPALVWGGFISFYNQVSGGEGVLLIQSYGYANTWHAARAHLADLDAAAARAAEEKGRGDGIDAKKAEMGRVELSGGDHAGI